MTGPRDPKPKAPAREDRLKAALKANLARRKAQARARADVGAAQDTGHTAEQAHTKTDGEGGATAATRKTED